MLSKYQLFSVLINLKYWYYNNPPLQLPRLPCHLCWISPWPTETPLQRNHHLVLHQFSFFFLPHSTTRHNYWIYQTIYQTTLLKFVIKLYRNHNTLLVKQTTCQKAESLRGDSLWKLNSTVNNKFIFNTKWSEFSTKWYVLSHFHNPTCAYNHPYNFHQKSVTPLQLFFTYLFVPYLLIKSSLQSPLKLSFSKPQQFFTSLLLRTAIPAIYIKSVFPTSAN